MTHRRSLLSVLVAVAVTGAAVVPCPPAAHAHAGDETVHTESHAQARQAADAAPPIPLVDGWCNRPTPPTAHLAEPCPCGCGDRSVAAGSSLGWMLLPSVRGLVEDPPAPAEPQWIGPHTSPPPVPIEHVPIS